MEEMQPVITRSPAATTTSLRCTPPPVKVAITHRHNQPVLVAKISQVFDPSIQNARDEQHAQCSLENTHLITLSQQLCDSQTTIEGLRAQVT